MRHLKCAKFFRIKKHFEDFETEADYNCIKSLTLVIILLKSALFDLFSFHFYCCFGCYIVTAEKL